MSVSSARPANPGDTNVGQVDRLALTQAEQALLRRAPDIGYRVPMLATLTAEPFSDDAWIYERKLDGVRAIGSRDRGEPALWSRNRKRMDAAYPELVEALAVHGPARFVADGEVVAFDGTQTSFATLQARIHLTDPARARRSAVAVYLYLFDLLVLGEVDLTRLPLRTRKRLLRATFGFSDPVRYSAHRTGDGRRFLELACARGWEGLIAKRADSAYQHRRSPDWRKLKCVRDQEFVVGGFTDPAGSRVGFGALLVGYYDGGRLLYAGKVGTGYNDRVLRSLRSRMDGLERPRSPFAERVAEPGAHWVDPELVAQVGFTEWTGDGRLRHPRFRGMRTDKEPRDVVREA